MGSKSIQGKVEDFYRDGFIADAHCDTLLEIDSGSMNFSRYNKRGHLDLARMNEGRIALQFFAAFIGSEYKPERSLRRALQLIETFYREVVSLKHDIVLGLKAKQISKELQKREKKVAILTIEGGECLAGDINMLSIYYRLGVRGLGLTWNQRNELADGVWENGTGGGLTRFGREVVLKMNNLGMIVDLAHISEKGFWDVVDISNQPLMVSHSNCKDICNHPRNLSNEQIKAIATKGGVVGLTFAPDFIGDSNDLDALMEHVDHLAGLVGTDNFCFGSDFDGVTPLVKGIEDVSKMPKLVTALLKRGYTVEETEKIMGKNLINFVGKVLG